MKIRITKEHLKNADYQSCEDCPLARALKDKGYTRVSVGGWIASGFKNGKKVVFKFGYYGTGCISASKVAEGKPFTADIKIVKDRL